MIDPYIAGQLAAVRRDNKKRNRQEVGKQRKEAEQAVMLMKETVVRIAKMHPDQHPRLPRAACPSFTVFFGLNFFL